ncbi:profilin [Talaromyces proteolyticus]|uniref:Profilin n=1 Tax=Talaromyces proteolyticus TaxID=1131652 RepID=A0AAD4KED2_9EURO|nr:profilin [Talaromyces proteolyticus]KAH8689940.1 profilin [Talaromyces proteolyticus]
MSWDPFAQGVVAQGTFDKVIVVDSTGQTTWGKGGPIEVSDEEISVIVGAFTDPQGVRSKGPEFEGEKYVLNKIDDDADIPIMLVQKTTSTGKQGIVAAKCNKAVFIAHYLEASSPIEAISSAVTQAAHINKYT